MCGRYSLFAPPDEIEAHFGATFSGEFEPRYNAAPRQSLPVISDAGPDTIQSMEWGFVPPWADDRADFGFINARAETLAEKPTFEGAFRTGGRDGGDPRVGRCLVPADGFYEWTRTEDGKQPYRVTLDDGSPFAMAGLWAEYQPERTQAGLGDFAGGAATAADPETVMTYAIVTTEPNDLVADLHDRMSVILPPDDYRPWLDDGPDEIRNLLKPYPAEKMRAYPVSQAVNDPSNDSPAVAQPIGGTDDGSLSR